MENKKDNTVQSQTLAKELSVSALAKQLENGELAPASLSQKVLKQYVVYRSACGYENYEIAEILGCTIRSVQRYLKAAKKDNLLNICENFQKTIFGEFLNNWKSEYNRLKKASYSEQLSDAERAKIIYALHQLDVSKIITLERLGYISQAQGIEESKAAIKQNQLKAINSEMDKIRLSIYKTNKRIDKIKDPAQREDAIEKTWRKEIELLDMLIAGYDKKLELRRSLPNQLMQ